MEIYQVRNAIQELTRRGEVPSVRKVHALTGGSFRDVSRLLNNLKGQQVDEQPGQTDTTGVDAPARKVYTCQRFPSLRIGSRVQFTDGAFATSDPDEQAVVERCDWYGVYITEPIDQKHLPRD